eukprot:SAG25_NODE_368_length_9082_cov_5.789937_7_plen_169_part_00
MQNMTKKAFLHRRYICRPKGAQSDRHRGRYLPAMSLIQLCSRSASASEFFLPLSCLVSFVSTTCLRCRYQRRCLIEGRTFDAGRFAGNRLLGAMAVHLEGGKHEECRDSKKGPKNRKEKVGVRRDSGGSARKAEAVISRWTPQCCGLFWLDGDRRTDKTRSLPRPVEK